MVIKYELNRKTQALIQKDVHPPQKLINIERSGSMNRATEQQTLMKPIKTSVITPPHRASSNFFRVKKEAEKAVSVDSIGIYKTPEKPVILTSVDFSLVISIT